MKISLIQMNSVSDKSLNIAKAVRLMEEAIRLDQPDLLVLPEHFDWAGGSVEEKVAAGEARSGGPAWTACADVAAKHGVNVLSGSFYEKVEGEPRVFNTSVMFDRKGEEIARYKKIHMFDITTPDGMEYRESASVKPGDDVVVAEVDGWKVGLSICYDIRFPELFQRLAAQGAELIVLPAAFTTQTGKDHWEVLSRARAIETECYFAACGSYGEFKQGAQTRSCYGHSLVVDPWGHVVGKASDGDGFVTVRLDRGMVERVRTQIPVQKHKVL